MYCKYCGEFNRNEAFFCKKCGGHITKVRSSWIRNNRFSLLLLLPLIAAGAAYYINTGLLSSYVDVFPLYPTQAKTTTLSCSYGGKNLKTEITLYRNYNNYYKGHNYSDKEGYIKNGQFDQFVYVNSKDPTIKNLVSSIRGIASSNRLNDDQTLELTTCFIQNIPYDSSKAELVLKQVGNNADTEQYPYQTLYSNNGICTDKTYLGSAMIKELGYGNGLLVFKEQEHMALGITVLNNYASFGSKYLYMEMTSLTPPGLIPSNIDSKNGLPITFVKALKQLDVNDNPDSISFDTTTVISKPDFVIDINGGKLYSRIASVRNLEKSIGDAMNSLSAKKANLQKAKGEVDKWNKIQASDYSSYLAEPETYQSCFPSYSSYPTFHSTNVCSTRINTMKSFDYNSYTISFNNYKKTNSYYNSLVDDYNATLDKINKDINTYQTYQYSS